MASFLEIIDIDNDENLVLLVASQSCDITTHNIDSDPYVELSVARKIDSADGNFTHNKNPRTLHTHITCRTTDSDVFTQDDLELRAFEKHKVLKNAFSDLCPDKNRVLEDRFLLGYIAWLAARYSRPALPTTFNDLINKADTNNRLRDKIKKDAKQLVGIYVEIIPDAEIEESETYRVNLLGLLPAGFTGNRSRVEKAIVAYQKLLSAEMDVTTAIKTEDEVSVAAIKRFKRFYYDSLSIRTQSPLPVEAQNIL